MKSPIKSKLLVTGGCGFIGSNFVRYMLEHYPEIQLVNIDKLTYAGNPDNLKDLKRHPAYRFVKGDITDPQTVARVMKGIDQVIHFAAESHVDRSIEGPSVFVKTNVLGTFQLLNAAMKAGVKRFIQVSTDEVYGSLEDKGYFTEQSSLAPNSPYSSSKAGADLLARSYFTTYGFPVIITRCSNNYGPYQYPEKFLPVMIANAMANKKLPVYGDGRNVRDWLHVEDHCRALDLVLAKGRDGEIYNIGGHNEWANIDLAKLLLKKLGRPESLIQFVKDRLGHDRRYAIDSSKIRQELEWSPQIDFESGLSQTIEWYKTNTQWLERIRNREKST